MHCNILLRFYREAWRGHRKYFSGFTGKPGGGEENVVLREQLWVSSKMSNFERAPRGVICIFFDDFLTNEKPAFPSFPSYKRDCISDVNFVKISSKIALTSFQWRLLPLSHGTNLIQLIFSHSLLTTHLRVARGARPPEKVKPETPAQPQPFLWVRSPLRGNTEEVGPRHGTPTRYASSLKD